MNASHARWVFVVAISLTYGALLIYGLRFDFRGDETHFWSTTLRFSETLIPSIEHLRDYDDLNTPLPFVVFGALEHAFGGGIRVGRAVNMLLSTMVVFLVGWPRYGDQTLRRPLAVLGLLLCPYYLFVSGFLYTDMMAIFLVVVGVSLHRRRLYWLAAISFVLAVSSRQYMVAFPVALAAYELLQSRGRWPGLRASVVAPSLAAASLFGWVWLFGGPAPAMAIRNQDLMTANVATLMVPNALYSLACVGVYFVAVEYVLFQRWRNTSRSHWITPVSTTLAGVIIAGFVWFPPLHNVNFHVPSMGYLDLALRFVLEDSLRMAVLCAFAVLAVLRFHRVDLASLFVAMNTVTMLKAHVGWDKYAVPLLACLWLIAASDYSRDEVANARFKVTTTDPNDLG